MATSSGTGWRRSNGFLLCRLIVPAAVALLGLVTSCEPHVEPGVEGQSSGSSEAESVCSIARDLRDTDFGLGEVYTRTFAVRDAFAVELRYLLGRLRVVARRGDLDFLDAIEPPTRGLEAADLADVLTIGQRGSAQRLSDAVLSECGFALSPRGALLRPTTYVGGDGSSLPAPSSGGEEP